ncbi:hypothetical protein GS518_16675 [Leptospira interrogans]|uniref:Uncharacterized protein n=1 Tax=Leptospira interrogans serogroup Icterohaemorrhagiae serovar copenhageni (strain Fiocruz L1-130) TaxID=267671 RepID=Q72M67_LEPIC|nr:conserved hypothetical protein [Leptospira interrogans serovar Copenhageni str. Fiocruz L1-130]KAA5545841.1 hypothetical protein F3G11_19015 [Leptospira interrogans serovar Copenhageni]QHH37115.1 hypothetical protein GS519_16665 [Leptospira interrogans]QOI48362.1 hypothetical protein Lepto898_17750 [Leptospira interrogans serovar Icterohaemorrhagiae]MTY93513.1 hypothetical protein [Leptospira interrogans serovar Copenhageni]
MRHSENTENWYGSLDNRIFPILLRDLECLVLALRYGIEYKFGVKKIRKEFSKSMSSYNFRICS